MNAAKRLRWRLHRLRNSSARLDHAVGVERGNRPYRSDSDWIDLVDAALGVVAFREAA